MSLIFPGKVDAKERLNIEKAYKSPLNFTFFKFKVNLIDKLIPIVTIPKDHLIYNISPIIIEDAFNGSEVYLNIGNITNQTSVTHVRINNITNILILPMFQDLGKDFGKIISVSTQILAGIKWEIEKPTKGSGYGIITLLNLNLVEGYR